MCDGWPAAPRLPEFYSTPIGTDSDPYSPVHSVGARPTLRLHDACGAVRERATNPLHRAGVDPKPLGDLTHAWPPRSRQGLTDSFFECGGYPRPPEPFSFALGPRQASTDSFLDHGALELGKHTLI